MWLYMTDEVPRVYRPVEIRQSGFCILCRERYNDVPVIDNIPVCPNCYEIVKQ